MIVYFKNIIFDDEPIFINIFDEYYCEGEHKHNFMEFEYILSGSGTHIINGKRYRVNVGDLFFTNKDSSHYFESDEKDHIIVYNCAFDDNMTNEISRTYNKVAKSVEFMIPLPNIVNEPYIRLWDRDFTMRNLLDKMHYEFINTPENYREAIFAYFLELNVVTSRMFKEQSGVDKIAVKSGYIYDVLQYIHAHHREDVNIEELAKIACISSHYLCERFKEVVGMPISKYVLKMRVNTACALLRETNKTFSEIVGEVGYKDEKFFRKVFKELIGKTPSEYKKILK